MPASIEFPHADLTDDNEPRFLECVKLNFDRASMYLDTDPGLLEVSQMALPWCHLPVLTSFVLTTAGDQGL